MNALIITVYFVEAPPEGIYLILSTIIAEHTS